MRHQETDLPCVRINIFDNNEDESNIDLTSVSPILRDPSPTAKLSIETS